MFVYKSIILSLPTLLRTLGILSYIPDVLPSVSVPIGTETADLRVQFLVHFLGHIAGTMLSRPSILSALKIASRQRPFSIQCSTLQRRLVSTEPPKLVGPMDNAFNRERLAVKHHAAQSAGEIDLRSLAC